MVVKIYVLLLCLALSFSEAFSATSNSPCDGKVIIEQGSNLFSDPTDCSKYVMCSNYEEGSDAVVTGHTKYCSFPTYWSDNKKTCDFTDQVECTNDFCRDKADATRRPGYNNCRGYWECSGGASVHKCCEFGQMFDNDISACQEIPEGVNCTDSCDSDVNATVDATITCDDKKAIADEPQYYMLVREGFNDTKLPCGAGTIFNATTCNCDHDTGSTVEKMCKADLYLPFDENTEDKSDIKVKLVNHNVNVTNGFANFNGVDSELVVSRYNNMGAQNAFILNMEYSSEHLTLNSAQTLVSNDHCQGVSPSVMISEDKADVNFTIGLGLAKYETLQVSQPATSDKSIKFQLLEGVFTATVNGVSKSVNATEPLQNTLCAVTIGSSRGGDFFTGKIAELSIYLCEPQSP